MSIVAAGSITAIGAAIGAAIADDTQVVRRPCSSTDAPTLSSLPGLIRQPVP
jgi:hypothetical protein